MNKTEKIFSEMKEMFHKVRFNPDTGEVASKQVSKDGFEYLDDTPMAPPVGYKRQPSMFDIIREQVHMAKFQADLAAAGYETFEESDDFDIGDDYEPNSRWENDLEPSIKEVVKDYEARQALNKKNDGPNGRGMSQDEEEPKAPPSRAKKPAKQPPVDDPDE